jgi:hypothetical protein
MAMRSGEAGRLRGALPRFRRACPAARPGVRQGAPQLRRARAGEWRIALCCLALSAGTCRAEEAAPLALGVLPPAAVEIKVEVPPDGLWRAPQSTFVCADTLVVMDTKGNVLPRATEEPRQGQFAWRPEGVVRFSREDAGRGVVVRYQFSPRRVAVLDAATPTDYPDAVPLLGQVLAEELGKRGLIPVSAKELADAAAAVSLGPASPHALPSSEKLMALARRVNAAYVVVPGVAVGHYSNPGTVDVGIEWPQDRVGDQHPRNPVEEPSVPVPVTHDRLSGGVRITVVEGATGATITDQVKSGSQPVHWRRFSAARRALVRDLAAQVVAAWREPSR